MDCEDILIKWLNNAYSMELSMVKTLEAHAKDADELPEVKEMIEKHIETTKEQAEKVKNEIERLGGDTSSIKAGMSEMFGSMSGLASDMTDDKIVKNAIAEHAAEHFEMATYMSIIHAAEMCGEDETADVAREIMEQETTTGKKVEENINMIVEYYINQKTMDNDEEDDDYEEE